MNGIFNVAIMGAGSIAGSMAEAISGLHGEVTLYAIGSRNLEKAEAFSKKWNVQKAYGSYEELVKDKNIDLVYIATPHSEHYKNALLCIENGQNVLVEKAFCGNLKQTEDLLKRAMEKSVFVGEAMWTRYQPSYKLLKDILKSGKIGKVTGLESHFDIYARGKERLEKPELAGGALLDLGVYSLTVPAMYMGTDIAKMESNGELNDLGVDLNDEIIITYKDGVKAYAYCSFDSTNPGNYAKITGDKGSVEFGPINVPEYFRIFDVAGNVISEEKIPVRVNGYEYEVLECKECIENGELEPRSMPHTETVLMMKWMDDIRRANGVVYPFE